MPSTFLKIRKTIATAKTFPLKNRTKKNRNGITSPRFHSVRVTKREKRIDFSKIFGTDATAILRQLTVKQKA